jgi:RNA polymerase sigma-70 factor (ECF subfamily)
MPISREDFEAIVHQHQRMLYRVAWNFFRNASIAQEIVQDVLLQLFETEPAIASTAHLQSWLRRAVTHRCIDLARRKHTHLETQVDDLPDVAEEAPESDPLLDDRLRRLVASLPEIQRLVVILRFGEDMDSEEIAAALDLPSPTVRSHLQRALALLREKAPRVLGGEINVSTGRQSS